MGLFGKDKEKGNKEDKTYHMVVECINCDSESEFDIPYGTALEDFQRGKFCTVCGCMISGKGDKNGREL